MFIPNVQVLIYLFFYAILFLNNFYILDGDIMYEEENKEKKKKIEIVKGDSKDLNISEVKDSLNFEKPEENKKKNIIIPENQDNE